MSARTGSTAALPGGRLLTGATLAVLAALPFVVLRLGTAPISDPDAFWHVVAGERLWQTWQFAGPDPLPEHGSFATAPFVYHQWLPELAMAAANALAGLAGVAWLFDLMLLAFVVTVYVVARRRAGILCALVVTVLTWVGASGSLSPRPQVLGFVLLAVSVDAWLATADDGRLRWSLLPLTWVWACTHGSWVYAPALGALVTLGQQLDARSGRRPGGPSWGRRWGFVALLVAVGACTPVGPRLLLVPFEIAEVGRFISEWQPTRVTLPQAAVVLVLALVVVTAWLRRAWVGWSRWLVWVLAVVSTLVYARTIAVGAVLLAPLLAPVLQSWVPRRSVGRRWEAGLLAGPALVSLVVAALVVPGRAGSAREVPSALGPSLAALADGTVVWDEEPIGGWLLYAHPNVRPTIDPRAEVYGPGYLGAYLSTLRVEPGWESRIDGSGARYALVEADGPLADALRRTGWTARGTDAGYVLLQRP